MQYWIWRRLKLDGDGCWSVLLWTPLSSRFRFYQVLKLPTVTVDSCNGGNETSNGVSIVFVGDELQKVIFDIMATLINSCNLEQLDMIQSKLSKNVLVYMRDIWRKVYLKINYGDSHDLKGKRCGHLSNIKANNLAETIFRLSMIAGEYLTYPLEQVLPSFFGKSDHCFQNFILNYWEESSFVLRSSECLNGKENIFGSFASLLNCEEAISSFFSNSLRRMVSCLPFASDDLDILDFLREVKETIGCTIIYQQDIRVVKTDDQIEMHFFSTGSVDRIESSDVFSSDDILRCEEGYKQGYTIALRGLEFRFELIAAVADAIASLFGQPSVGVNLYMTPPNSQGLARHYDDHCVFVCQLIGEKQWTIAEQPTLRLPRLYEPLQSDCCSHVENVSKEMNCLLKEGDVLYIPRGLAHEACTMTRGGELDANNGFSLHLTFGIEVEPPFEWEGFAHVALHCWSHNQDSAVDPLSLHLLHFAIRHISHSNPDFRKACLAGAIQTQSETDNLLQNSQTTNFTHIMDVISTQSSYSGAIKELEAALRIDKDPFKWLEHLNQDICSIHGPSPTITELSDLCHLSEAAFMQTKSNFCDSIVFADVVVKYKMLLDKYRKARKQYTKGMLSLHCFNN
ncbi:hypothetical protein QQ045_027985 [Rhodiola kirilowii]